LNKRRQGFQYFCRNLTEDELKDKYNFNHSYDRAGIMEAIKQAKKEDGDETDVSHFLCFDGFSTWKLSRAR
jgi:pantothenate kinase